MPIAFAAYPLLQDFKRSILAIKEGQNEAYKNVDHPILFYEMLNSDLSPEENIATCLFQEAQVIIGAAILTTS